MKTLFKIKEIVFLVIALILSLPIADYVTNKEEEFALHLMVVTSCTFAFYILQKVIENQILKEMKK